MDRDDPETNGPRTGVDGTEAKGAADQTAPKRARNDLTPARDIRLIPIEQLQPASRRIRRAMRSQIQKVKRSIEAFGCVRDVLITSTHVIIDGHVVVEALREMGARVVPCRVIDHLSDTAIRQLSITLNRTQETGSWDDENLRVEFAELLKLDVDLTVTGFEIPEIDFRLGNFSISQEETDPLDDLGEILHATTTPITRRGDVWIAGEHRVICGRAQDLAGMAAEVNFGSVDVLVADVPFNVPVNGHVSTVRGRHQEFAEASGEMTPEAFVDFLDAGLRPSTLRLKPGGIGFIFMDWRHVREVSEAFLRLGVEVINMAVWVKSAPGMGALYRSQHELVFVVRRPGASHRNNVQLGRFGRNRSNVWEYGGATSGNTTEDDFSAHPTVKPVRMIRDALLDVSAPGELVVDCFLGSGTTLIAAETSQRRCLGVEIEPAYVDHTLRRWMTLTGGDAVHAVTGETFACVEKRRQTLLLSAPTQGGADA